MDSDRRDHPSRGRSGSGLTARPLPLVVGAQAVLETDEAKVCVCARGVLRHDTGDGTVCRCRDTAIRNAPGTRSNTAERTEGADAFGAVGHSAEPWCCCVCRVHCGSLRWAQQPAHHKASAEHYNVLSGEGHRV